MTTSAPFNLPLPEGSAAPGSATAELISWATLQEAHRRTAAELLPIQLESLDERLAERRAQIPVLDRRALDVGVDHVKDLDDLVPLLFSHQTYKSYPETFVVKGQWSRMNAWLDTLSTAGVRSVDVEGVADVDDWLDRLRAAGHHVRASSGTTGKTSFLNWTELDLAWHRVQIANAFVMSGMEPGNTRVGIFLGPPTGYHRPSDGFRVSAEFFVRPDQCHYLLERPASVAELNRWGAIRKAMEDGTVTPADLEQMRLETDGRSADTEHGLARLVEVLRAHRDEPVFVRAAWAELVQLVDAARAAGMEDGPWAPGSIVASGGGQKSKLIPDDFLDRTTSFFQGCLFVDTFGMSEINNSFPVCPANRMHAPAQLLPIILDETGEQVLSPPSGQVVGRLALFDFTLDGRWGGVITSDEVHADFSPCPCGMASMTLEKIQRYGQGTAAGDDKLTCAGTISAYVRGAISA